MEISREKIINHIIAVEGGYVDDPDDSGGATNFGITEAVARANGYQGHMRDLPRQTAFDIYAAKYWDSVKADDLKTIDPRICAEVVDTGVNMGVGRASRFLQRALTALNNRGAHYPDIVVDGRIGPATVAALQAYVDKRDGAGVTVLLRLLNALQCVQYVKLVERREKDEKFLFGWVLNRGG